MTRSQMMADLARPRGMAPMARTADLFAADRVGLEATTDCIRAVTALEAGDYARHRQLVASAAEGFAKALAHLNSATVTVTTSSRPTAAVARSEAA